MNTIGEIFRFTDFGESHGAAVGGVIDGCPAGLRIDMEAISADLDRRAGRTSDLPVSARAKAEKDEVEFLSGVLDGVTLGSPIAFIIRNQNARSADYDALRNTYRAGHADMTYQEKYGIRDWRGGGRASARETAARVVAGSIAKQILAERGVSINAEVIQIGEEKDPATWLGILEDMIAQNDSIGGIVECKLQGLPVGVGEPLFDKLQARLAYAMLSINACKGFEYGSGFEGVARKGSEINKLSGGSLGGISDGTEFRFRCVFKPTASIKIGGRHDVCVALRAPVIVEAMAAMTIVDLMMLSLSNRQKL